MLSNSCIVMESRDWRMSVVIVGSCRDCLSIGGIAIIVTIIIVRAISASMVKNWAFVFILAMCINIVVLFYFGRL